ncbi:hypothetical protein [Flagellimonas allohymeniacidonis]|uniref:PepSY domain-containing protein n=1 Tax=Flagellimonas allohymeniacidonis TaxID=2517819 RepID=A0A4Q8QC59_9FLAO|nr:hypothetical protein [Allomuricauda hymeniacidonis]TAI47911.1 hypothetical protein EW142_14770 [Allomuricauda hymeniacidonis]
MKSIVSDIRKFSSVVIICTLLGVSPIWSQDKNEREFRISKSELPKNAFTLIEPKLEDAKRIRFYQETDGAKRSFEVKFKKGRLHYSVEFDTEGQLEDVEFIIKPNDIPEDSWNRIVQYLGSNFKKYKVKKIQQQYPSSKQNNKKTIREAFQNLILPYINYELIFSAKNEKGYQHYEALFNSEGKFVKVRRFALANYDHVLY